MEFSRQEHWSGFFLLQGILLTQELNLGLLYCRWILYHLSHQGSLFYYDFLKSRILMHFVKCLFGSQWKYLFSFKLFKGEVQSYNSERRKYTDGVLR